jgi:glycosyltransferase involved in cell wall biosynthesis
MKLLITLDFPPEIGGIQRYLFDIVRYTFSSNDIVLAGCVRKPGHSYKELQAKVTWVSSPISFLNKKWSCVPLFLHFLKLIFSKKNIKEISCGNVYAGIVPWAASFFIRLRYTVYTHGTEILFYQQRTLRGRILKSVLTKADHLYSNSSFTCSLLKEAGIKNVPEIIPPRIKIYSPDDISAKWPEKTVEKAADTRPQILCVGRLVARKGFAFAIEALALLPQDIPWQCVIVGDGPLGQQLKTMCRNKNIEHSVIFKKRLSDEELSREFDRSTMFVLPGASEGGVEGFGIVLIEAMAHRVPVIAGSVGAVPEVLDNGACGILVGPGDVAGLSGEIRRLLGDASLRNQLAAAAFNRVKRCYAW